MARPGQFVSFPCACLETRCFCCYSTLSSCCTPSINFCVAMLNFAAKTKRWMVGIKLEIWRSRSNCTFLKQVWCNTNCSFIVSNGSRFSFECRFFLAPIHSCGKFHRNEIVCVNTYAKSQTFSFDTSLCDQNAGRCTVLSGHMLSLQVFRWSALNIDCVFWVLPMKISKERGFFFHTTPMR